MSGKTYTLDESWKIRGRYYGYPECCIESFINLEHLGSPDRKLKGTGYVPCAKCDSKTEVELIDIINSNRKAPRPFPREERDDSHMMSIIQELIND